MRARRARELEHGVAGVCERDIYDVETRGKMENWLIFSDRVRNWDCENHRTRDLFPGRDYTRAYGEVVNTII